MFARDRDPLVTEGGMAAPNIPQRKLNVSSMLTTTGTGLPFIMPGLNRHRRAAAIAS